MSSHARLSPSSAHRWLQCPGSVRLSEQIESSGGHMTSVYAEEGTQAHTVAEIEASFAFGLITKAAHAERLMHWRDTTPTDRHDDMLRHAAAYVDLLKQFAAEYPHTQVSLEQRVDTGVDASWGTLDAALVSPTHLHVVDFKYGMGIPVDAGENPQLMLYGVGGLLLYEDLADIETVCMTVHQPRLGSISHYCVSAEELRQWRDQVVKPAAALALSRDAYFAPSDTACRFCPAAGDCRARMEFITRRDFGDPDLLRPAEMGDLLAQIPDIMNWCNAVQGRALHQAYNEGIEIPGWKVVRSGGRRNIIDQPAAIEVLVEKGYPRKEVARESIQTLSHLEKLVGGKVRLNGLLGPLLAKSEGAPSLVPDQDSRPAIDPTEEARAEFSD